MMAFNSFINRSGLIDLPLHCRSYTWYKTDGSCKSRINRVLLNNHCMSRWPNIYQKGLRRTGPKPFRCLNTWFSHPGFGNFVKDKWRSYNVERWGGFIVKEKLKFLKTDMKEWNSLIFGNLDTAIESHKQVIQELDAIDDTFGLDKTEIIRRDEAVALLLRDLKRKNSIYINRRWKKNEIVGIELNGEWCEEVVENHFKSEGFARPIPAVGFTSKTISNDDNVNLIAPFEEDEVRTIIWECDSSKSPGPDGFNFGFFKTFRETLKEDMMKLMRDIKEFKI
ncbi:hypothetical protein ACS0TY_021144 [Phlomoides rotata]